MAAQLVASRVVLNSKELVSLVDGGDTLLRNVGSYKSHET
jgi:hypothetical protein